MKRKFKYLLGALIAASVVPASLGAESLGAKDLLGPAIYSEVLSKGKAVRTGGGKALELLPLHSSSQVIRAALAAEKPSLVVETVFILQRKGSATQAGRQAELAAIYGLMRSFGTLKGIEYYSVSRATMRVLYEESYRIDDVTTRSALPDPPPPAAASIPKSESILALQRDLTFGTNVYRYSFESQPEAVLVEMTNLTRMSYGLIPMLGPEGLKSHLLVIPADDAIIFYVESSAMAPGLVRSRLGESFANRGEALFRWFASKSATALPHY